MLQSGKSQLRVRHGGFLRGVDCFDAALFGITGAEAELMDPQQRLLMEVTWEVVQHSSLAAGSTSSSAAGGAAPSAPPETGVYVGIQQMAYGGLVAPHLHSSGPFSATGGSSSVAAGRLSFTYGYKGPAVSIDTACSSALVATHQGVLQLRGKPQQTRPIRTPSSSSPGCRQPPGSCQVPPRPIGTAGRAGRGRQEPTQEPLSVT